LKAAPAAGKSRRAQSLRGDSAPSLHTPMMQRLER